MKRWHHRRSARSCIRLALLFPIIAAVSCRERHDEVPTRYGACDLPVPSWLVLGPFRLDTGALRLDRSDIGDPASSFPAAGDAPPGSPRMRWRRVDSDSLGRVDLYSVLPEPSLDDRAAYALTYVESPGKRTVRLVVESDDDVVVWVDGRRVLRQEVARELRSGEDTVTFTLSPGVNRLLYRVVNRGGGFGLGARFLNASPDPTGDLRIDAGMQARARAGRDGSPDVLQSPRRPSSVVLGPAKLEPRALIESDVADTSTALIAPIRVCVTRRSPDAGADLLVVGSDSEPVPPSGVGKPVIVTLHPRWSELARAALAGQPSVEARQGDTTMATLRLPVTPDALLTLLSRPIRLDDWRATLGGDAGALAWLAYGSREIALGSRPDSALRTRVTGLGARLRIPEELAGLTLAAGAGEFGRDPVFTVNDRRPTPDSLGRVELCGPCRAGEPLAFSIAPIRGPWWDAPLVRVRDPGWREIRDGAVWARYFTGDSSLAVPDSTTATELLRSVLDASKSAYAESIDRWMRLLAPASERVRRDTIDIVGHSHIDAAWIWRWRQGREAVEKTWATVAKLMAKYPDMHFAASSAQYYVWLEQNDPELLARIQALVREGRWDPVGGWWVESDANIPSGESLVRQGLYGQRTYMRLFGKTSRVAWLPNSFGFAWSLPQILRKSGFEFFVTQELRWNDTNAWPPGLNAFWWEGPDGSRVFTDMLYAYDHDLSPRRLAKEFVVTRDSSASRRMLTPYGVGDHGGGPTMAMLERARSLQRVPTFPVVRDVSPDSSLSRMRLDALEGPVLRDELYLEYHRGVYTTQAAVKRRNRELEALLGTAEAAAAIAPAPYPRDSLRAAWKRVLFNQFHDILPGTATDSVYRDVAMDYAHAERLARAVLDSALAGIAAALETRPQVAGDTAYVVFNPSGYPRTDVVRLSAPPGSEVRDGAGRVLPSVARDSTIEVLVPEVPAVGAKVIFLRSGAAPSLAGRAAGAAAVLAERPVGTTGGTAAGTSAGTGASGSDGGGGPVLENAAMRVAIDPATGNIARLDDKLHGISALKAGAGGLLLIEDRPQLWDAWNIDNLDGQRAWVDRDVRVGPVVRTPLGESVTVWRRRDSTQVIERYELRTDAERLDIELTVAWHESHRLLKLVVPLGFHIDSTRAEIPYASIARPTRPRTRRDSARFETPMQRWVDGSERAYGVAIVNDGSYGYSAHGDTIFVTLLRSPKSPDPNADMGAHTFRLSIVPHAGDWRASEIRRAATSINQPLVARRVPVHAGRGRSASWLSIVSSTVELGALKGAEDGDRYIVRLVETSGRATRARLRVAAPVLVTEVDMLERNVPGGYQARGTTIDVPLGPFEIKTVAVQPSTSAGARDSVRR